MTHKEKIHGLFDAMALELAAFIKESESAFPGGWVPATYLKDQLELKSQGTPGQ